MAEEIKNFIQQARESLRDEFLYPDALLEPMQGSIDDPALLMLTKAINRSILHAKSLFRTARLDSIRDFSSDFATYWYSLETTSELWCKHYQSFIGLESGDHRWAETHYPTFHLMAISELHVMAEAIFFLTDEKIIHAEISPIQPAEKAQELAMTLVRAVRGDKALPKNTYFLTKFQNHEAPSRKAIDKKWAAIRELFQEFERYDWEQLIGGLQQEMKSLLGIKTTKLNADISSQDKHVLHSSINITAVLSGLSSESQKDIIQAAYESQDEWLSIESLASKAGVGLSTLYRNKKALVEKGLLKIGENGRGIKFSLDRSATSGEE